MFKTNKNPIVTMKILDEAIKQVNNRIYEEIVKHEEKTNTLNNIVLFNCPHCKKETLAKKPSFWSPESPYNRTCLFCNRRYKRITTESYQEIK